MNSIMETVCNVCNTVKQKSKHGVSFQTLLTTLRREFRKKHFEVKIKSLRHKVLNTEEFYINAYYDSEDDKAGDFPIEVVVHHNFDKEVIWDKKHITEFLIQIFDAVVHEFKHQRQSLKRNYKQYWDHFDADTHYKEYLADTDEVDAYALSIAIELCRNLGKYRALRYLQKVTSLAKLKFNRNYVSPNLAAYVGYFGNLNDPTLKKLSKKIYIRLQKIDTDVIFV